MADIPYELKEKIWGSYNKEPSYAKRVNALRQILQDQDELFDSLLELLYLAATQIEAVKMGETKVNSCEEG
jgi:hypothetical protein